MDRDNTLKYRDLWSRFGKLHLIVAGTANDDSQTAELNAPGIALATEVSQRLEDIPLTHFVSSETRAAQQMIELSVEGDPVIRKAEGLEIVSGRIADTVGLQALICALAPLFPHKDAGIRHTLLCASDKAVRAVLHGIRDLVAKEGASDGAALNEYIEPGADLTGIVIVIEFGRDGTIVCSQIERKPFVPVATDELAHL